MQFLILKSEQQYSGVGERLDQSHPSCSLIHEKNNMTLINMTKHNATSAGDKSKIDATQKPEDNICLGKK